ncbi:MAG: MopE-related protein [Myxococcota bacterium]
MRTWWVSGCSALCLVGAGVASASDEFPAVPEPEPCAEVNQDFTGEDCTVDFGTSDLDFCFDDSVPSGSGYPNKNGGDGQIFVLGNQNGAQDCGTVLVKETGYYAIFDSELSESCADQKDETGYLTVANSCNGDGWAVERNVGERYLVLDADNEGAGCTDDGQCTAGKVCREGNSHGNCCVPAEPVYMGTFLLVAGEENVICINHWCPEWEAAQQNGDDLGFVHDPNDKSANCTSADSIHFKIAASSFVCKQEGYLQACQGGCQDGDCLPHPCFSANCPNDYCILGASGQAQCVSQSPCAGRDCEHGCVFGLCLQGPDARGDDADGDGFSNLADCNDDDAAVHPGAAEVCDNDIDDDCDGFVDCGGGLDLGDGVGGDARAADPAADALGDEGGGCTCRVGPARTRRGGSGAGLLLVVALAARRRHRRDERV